VEVQIVRALTDHLRTLAFLTCIALAPRLLYARLASSLAFEELRFAVTLLLDEEIVERFTHQVFDLAIKIKGQLLDRLVSVFAEIADEWLLANATGLDVARGTVPSSCSSCFWVLNGCQASVN
jgi:hypothetical protein